MGYLLPDEEMKRLARISVNRDGVFNRYKQDDKYILDVEYEGNTVNIITADNVDEWEKYQHEFFHKFTEYYGKVEIFPKQIKLNDND